MSNGKAGAPTVMTQEVMDAICEKLAGGESLRSICRAGDMPAISTVLLAVVQNRDGFSEQYMQAREAGGFSHADRIIDTVDRVASEEIDPHAARAMLDGLKWAAERMAPKKHSARQDVNHTSDDGSMSPQDNSIAVIEALKRKHAEDDDTE